MHVILTYSRIKAKHISIFGMSHYSPPSYVVYHFISNQI